MKTLKKLIRRIATFALAVSGTAITAHADALEGTDEVVGFIGNIKDSAVEIAIAIVAVALIGCVISLLVSGDKREAKSKIITILVACGILLFGEGIILGFFA